MHRHVGTLGSSLGAGVVELDDVIRHRQLGMVIERLQVVGPHDRQDEGVAALNVLALEPVVALEVALSPLRIPFRGRGGVGREGCRNRLHRAAVGHHHAGVAVNDRRDECHDERDADGQSVS
jgi:hypothetical protein